MIRKFSLRNQPISTAQMSWILRWELQGINSTVGIPAPPPRKFKSLNPRRGLGSSQFYVYRMTVISTLLARYYYSGLTMAHKWAILLQATRCLMSLERCQSMERILLPTAEQDFPEPPANDRRPQGGHRSGCNEFVIICLDSNFDHYFATTRKLSKGLQHFSLGILCKWYVSIV